MIIIIGLVIIFIEYYFYKERSFCESRNLILHLIAAPTLIGFTVFVSKKFLYTCLLIDSGMGGGDAVMLECFGETLLLLLLSLGFCLFVGPYIYKVMRAYYYHKSCKDSSAQYQRMNIKLFNKCFEVNPQQFIFLNEYKYNVVNSVTSKHTICYKYANKDGVCGIIASSFLCYLWMHDCIVNYRCRQEEKGSAISDDVKQTLEMRIEEIDKEMQEAMAAYDKNVAALKSKLSQEDNKKEVKYEIFDELQDRYLIDGKNYLRNERTALYAELGNYNRIVIKWYDYFTKTFKNAAVRSISYNSKGNYYEVGGLDKKFFDFRYGVDWEIYELKEI